MRIFAALCKYRPMFSGYEPKFPGNVYTGKHRWVPPVNRTHKYYVLRQILYEEECMKLLQHPYISEKQEQAYLQHVGKARPDYYDDFLFKKIAKPERQKYAADYIQTLNESRKFEIQE